jgi:hypothetical protein
MSRENNINIVLASILDNPSDDYNEGLVREAVRTYLNNFTDSELESEITERKESGRAQ